jgi:hypothetical protein
MDATAIVQATILIRAAIDGGKAVIGLLRQRRERLPDLIPVRRLVTREQLLRLRAERAIDITPRRQSQ